MSLGVAESLSLAVVGLLLVSATGLRLHQGLDFTCRGRTL